MIIRERPAAPFVPKPLTAIIAAKDQQCWHALDPRLPYRPFREWREDALFQSRIIDDDDVALLKVAFRRRAKREGTEAVQKLARQGLRIERPHDAARGHQKVGRWCIIRDVQ